MANGENKCRDSIESVVTDNFSKSNPLTKRGFLLSSRVYGFQGQSPV